MEEYRFSISPGTKVWLFLSRLSVSIIVGPILFIIFRYFGDAIPPIIHVVVPVAVLILIWSSYFTVPMTITTDKKQITFRSLIWRVTMELQNLALIEEIDDGRHIRFKFSKRSFSVPTHWQDAEKFISLLTWLVPHVHVIRYPVHRKILRYVIISLFLLLVLSVQMNQFIRLNPDGFLNSGTRNTITAIEQYKRVHGEWPNNLDAVKRFLPTGERDHCCYRYGHSKNLFMLHYAYNGGILGQDRKTDFYRSDKKQWKRVPEKSTPEGREYMALLLSLNIISDDQ